MIKVTISRTFPLPIDEVYSAIDHINKLARLKPAFRNYRIARDEEGLQLIDVDIRFIVKKFPMRFTYTAIPFKYCELKKLKGAIKEYSYTYTFEQSDNKTSVTADCAIVLPLRYFIVQPFLSAIIKHRLAKELTILEKIVNQKFNGYDKTTYRSE